MLRVQNPMLPFLPEVYSFAELGMCSKPMTLLLTAALASPTPITSPHSGCSEDLVSSPKAEVVYPPIMC